MRRVESSRERAAYGKSPTGIVTFRTVVRDERFVVEIAALRRTFPIGAMCLDSKPPLLSVSTMAALGA